MLYKFADEMYMPKSTGSVINSYNYIFWFENIAYIRENIAHIADLEYRNIRYFERISILISFFS